MKARHCYANSATTLARIYASDSEHTVHGIWQGSSLKLVPCYYSYIMPVKAEWCMQLHLFLHTAGFWGVLPWAQEYSHIPAVAHLPQSHLQIHKDCNLPYPCDHRWDMVCNCLGSHQRNSCILPCLGVWTHAEAYADYRLHVKPTLQCTCQGPFASTCRHYWTAVQMRR